MARHCLFTEDNPPTASAYLHPASLASGTASVSTYLRGDGTWATPESGSLPAGVIVMWSGLLANVPTGWVLCDGTGGTPDLRDRFIKGWTAGVDPGATGGATTHSHGTGTYAASAHAGAAVEDHGSHTHTYTQVVNHTHALSTILRSATTGGATTKVALTSDTSSTADTASLTDNPGGGVATGTTAGPSATLTHTVTQPSAHTLSGSSEAVNHEPTYFQLAYIMKS